MGKLCNFALVYILSLINFVVMLLPIGILILPVMFLLGYKGVSISYQMLCIMAFCVSAFMALYLVLDSLFGFTVRHYTKGLMPAQKANFIEGNQSAVPNAYAVGSYRKKAVIVTIALIQQLYDASNSRDDFISSIRAILAHEMSHLVNKDFIPGILVYSNEVIRRFITRIVIICLNLLLAILRIIPYIGRMISLLIITIYRFVDSSSSLFYRFVFKPLYEFLSRFLSRGMEYRCDKDAARLFGGQQVARALSKLGKGAYFSIFSTHPATKARMRHIQHVLPQANVISASILNQLVNMLAVLFLFGITYLLSLKIDMQYLFLHIITPILQILTTSAEFILNEIYAGAKAI